MKDCHWKLGRAVVLALNVSMIMPTSATAYSCIGKIEQVTTDPGGTVNATFTFQSGVMAWQDVCNVNVASNNVPTAACKTMLATLLSAKLAQRDVELWFDDATPNNCNATPWRPLRERGWYWGPSMK